MSAYIEAGVFFARVQPGDRFRFRVRPGSGLGDTDEGLVLTCTGPAARLMDAEDSLHVPFSYPPGHPHADGAFWRSACHDLQFEILDEETA